MMKLKVSNLTESLRIPLESDYDIVIEEYEIYSVQNLSDNQQSVSDYAVSGNVQALDLMS